MSQGLMNNICGPTPPKYLRDMSDLFFYLAEMGCHQYICERILGIRRSRLPRIWGG